MTKIERDYVGIMKITFAQKRLRCKMGFIFGHKIDFIMG